MLYREIIAVCSQIHTKHINTLCVQHVESLLNLVLQTVTSNFQSIKESLVSDFETVRTLKSNNMTQLSQI